MKHLIWAGMAASLLIQSPAFAVVADKFQCSIQLFRQGDVPGPRAESTIAVVRVPEATDPDWIAGVSASSGRSTLDLQTPEIKVRYNLDYKLFHSITAAKGAQWSCFGGTYEIPNRGSGARVCLSHRTDQVPYDPTDYNPETPLSNTGTPLFRSQDLRDYEHQIEGSRHWAKFRAKCQYLGTFE
jgi:hypothetical protein